MKTPPMQQTETERLKEENEALRVEVARLSALLAVAYVEARDDEKLEAGFLYAPGKIEEGNRALGWGLTVAEWRARWAAGVVYKPALSALPAGCTACAERSEAR